MNFNVSTNGLSDDARMIYSMYKMLKDRGLSFGNVFSITMEDHSSGSVIDETKIVTKVENAFRDLEKHGIISSYTKRYNKEKNEIDFIFIC